MTIREQKVSNRRSKENAKTHSTSEEREGKTEIRTDGQEMGHEGMGLRSKAPPFNEWRVEEWVGEWWWFV